MPCLASRTDCHFTFVVTKYPLGLLGDVGPVCVERQLQAAVVRGVLAYSEHTVDLTQPFVLIVAAPHRELTILVHE